ADDVYKLFVNNSEGEGRGLINRFDDALDQTKSQIESKAGKSYQTPDNYSLGREMKRLDTRVETFEKRMEKIEDRYWKQFTAMEKAIIIGCLITFSCFTFNLTFGLIKCVIKPIY